MTALDTPFSTFNFRVSLRLPEAGGEICSAEFSDCDGLEMSIEPKTIKEGGNNDRLIHLMGRVSYGQLTLKRGMTRDVGLWDWFERTLADRNHRLRARGRVEILSTDRTQAGSDGPKVEMAFELEGCLPTKLRVPSLSAKDGGLAIEEMQVAYEAMRRVRAGANDAG